jgi:trimethylamine---corrinoid protein Co-methyltransferase
MTELSPEELALLQPEAGAPETSDTPREAGGPRRRGGRAGHAGTGPGRLPQQRPWAQPRLRYAPTEVVSADELESIHLASLEVLERIGMDILDPEARELLRGAGANVAAEGARVRFDRDLVLERIRSAPEAFTLHASNPAHDLTIGGDWISFGSVASPPNVADLDRGRRVGNKQDFDDLVRLCQSLDVVHFLSGYPVEPIDIHPSVRHLEAIHSLLTLADKPIHAYSLGRQRNLDAMEMARIARGIDDATLDREPSIFTVINSSSPLRLDIPMCQGILTFSARNQVIAMTPFTLAGAMAPVTLAGALVEQNAEALAGMVLTQAVNPGAPVIYGGFTSNVDMQSGAPAFGTPEYMRTAMIGGQLARRYNVPYRSSNVSAANAVDAQAAYESMNSLWASVMGGAHLVYHGAGWMEGGLQASFEKVVVDVEMMQMMAEIVTTPALDDIEEVLATIADVPPGGHFFGAAHTLKRYRSAFYEPLVSDWRNHGAWSEAGSPTAVDRARAIWQEKLERFTPPPLDDDVKKRLDAYVAERKTALAGK